MKNLFLTFSLLGLITPAWAQQGPRASPVLDVQHYEISAEFVPGLLGSYILQSVRYNE